MHSELFTGTGGPPAGGCDTYVPSAREQAKDRKRAAIHEAGHVVVAQALGIKVASARIWRFDTGSIAEHCWRGQVAFDFRDHEEYTPAGRSKVRAIAFAGSVAEYIYESHSEPDPDCWSLDPDIMSPTDWEMARCKPCQLDNAAIKSIFRASYFLAYDGARWSKLLASARQLIIEASSN